MSGCCHEDHCSGTAVHNSAGWRRALWIALVVNAGMFLAEMTAGLAAGSSSLQADALDFLGAMRPTTRSALVWPAWRSPGGRRAALLKGTSLGLLGLWVLASTAWHAWAGTLPSAEVMTVVAVIALGANGGVALMLYRYRGGDANMRLSGSARATMPSAMLPSSSPPPASSARV